MTHLNCIGDISPAGTVVSFYGFMVLWFSCNGVCVFWRLVCGSRMTADRNCT
jgi:hypothetical protein